MKIELIKALESVLWESCLHLPPREDWNGLKGLFPALILVIFMIRFALLWE